MHKQAMNPFLPLWEYVPDGEPHVFGDRLYLFGSHDVAGGTRYCEAGDYVGWSAPVDDLGNWRYEGVVYRVEQDPRAAELGFRDLYAPDVVRGNDGRYYLYYSTGGTADGQGDSHNIALGVAVADAPSGPFEYHGFVRNPDGTPYLRYLQADPAVINDDGTIRLYYGWALSTVAAGAHGGASAGGVPDLASMSVDERRGLCLKVEQMLFHRSLEELTSEPEDVMGANHVVLADDMLTVASEPTRIVPGQFMAYGTSFEGHGFYEASSIRKIGQTYYFIYSDENSNMLCYATSDEPDRGFVYRGILQSNGDVGLNGRVGADRLNMTANNHGSIERVGDQWYVFYHRQTHNSTFSRQACAEPVEIAAAGSIAQAECTSCGLNGGPLVAAGAYSAAIACNITNGHMPHATNRVVGADIPYITHHGEGQDAGQHITNIKDGTRVVFKYFAFDEPCELRLVSRGGGEGRFEALVGEKLQGAVAVPKGGEWQPVGLALDATGTAPLTLVYRGEGTAELLEIEFVPVVLER